MGEFIVIVLIIFGFLYFIGLIFYGIDKVANAVSNKVSKESSSNERTQVPTEQVIDVLAREFANELLAFAKEIAIEEGLLDNYNKNEMKLFNSFLNYVKTNAEINWDEIAAMTCYALCDSFNFIKKIGYDDYDKATKDIFYILVNMQIYTNDLSIKEAFNRAVDLFLYGDMIDYLKKMNDENQN